jgi:hypothetical protein
MESPERVTLSALSAQIEVLEYQATTVLYLSAINLIANALMLVVAFLVSWT